MAEIDVGVQVQTDDGQWRSLNRVLDEMNDPAVLAVQRQFEQEARQNQLKARMAAIDAAAEDDQARRDHLRDRLQDFDDDFSRQMLAMGREPTE